MKNNGLNYGQKTEAEKAANKSTELKPAGEHYLILTQFVLMGKIQGKNPQYSPNAKTYLGFEYCQQRDNDGKRILIGRSAWGAKIFDFYQQLTGVFMTQDEKATEGVKPAAIVGKVYKAKITHDRAKTDPSKVYANISQILQRGSVEMFANFNAKNPGKEIGRDGKLIIFNIYENPLTDNPYASRAELEACEVYQALDDWQKDTIKKTIEYAALPEYPETSAPETPQPQTQQQPQTQSTPPAPNDDEYDDDLPF